MNFTTDKNGVISCKFDPADLGYTQEEWNAELALYCNCDKPDDHPEYKPDGINHMGCTKHGWICRKCNKFVQIG